MSALIYDDQWNVVQMQHSTVNPHTVRLSFPTNAGMIYQVRVFNYSPHVTTYTIGRSTTP